jgi:D-cysteine desulfhydrase
MANLPTRIEKLKEDYYGVKIYIKRDDQTGYELSGNKIRKLDYTLYDAVSRGCDTVITCGGIQSNHARATAIAAKKLGLDVQLVLKSNEDDNYSGNYFLDELVGADIHKISFEKYKNNRSEIMENIKNDLVKQGKKAYIIPEGASDGLGNLGYVDAYHEIVKQEEKLGFKFDYIVAAMGSGSTHAGLYIGSKLYNSDTEIIGYNIYNPDVDGIKMIYDLVMESKNYITLPEINKYDIFISADYVGRGYALSTSVELDFIKSFARSEGVLLDTVYTGKAMYGLVEDIKKGKYKKGSKVLFVHTGGVFGNFSKLDLFK